MLDTRADKPISVNKQAVTLHDSRASCATSSRRARTRRCSSSATATLRYGEIVAVIDAAKGAGVEKVGIVTEGMRKAGAGGN